jgi:hypothetical protein
LNAAALEVCKARAICSPLQLQNAEVVLFLKFSHRQTTIGKRNGILPYNDFTSISLVFKGGCGSLIFLHFDFFLSLKANKKDNLL